MIEKIAEVDTQVGEGPMWDVARQRLLWTDLYTGRMFSYEPATGVVATIHHGANVGGFVLNRRGGLLLCIWNGLLLWNSDDDWVRLGGESHEGVSLRFNDVIADPEGRLFAGTMVQGGLGKLYRFDPNGTVEIVEEGIGCSNGLGFSPDLRTMYYTDSAVRTIYAYDYDRTTGSVKNRRELAVLSRMDGFPDGITVDAEGYIWAAIWFGGCVLRLDPDGRVERRIETPALQPASVMFGGRDLSDLYVTTAALEVGPGSVLDPVGYNWSAYKTRYRGGALFRVRTEFQGREEFMADFPWPRDAGSQADPTEH